jgi:membrane associated rhomboid family serine protease
LNPIPPVTKVLLWAIGIIFLLQQLKPDFATYYFALWPLGDFFDGTQMVSPFQPWQLVTYAFLHGNFIHLLFNALMLVQFGPRLELTLGTKRYSWFLATCTIGAAVCQLGVGTWMHANGYQVGPTLGASGFVYGVLLAWAVFYPHDRVMMILPPIPMSVRTMVMVFGGIELFLGGMLSAWLHIRYWRGLPPFRRRPPPTKKKSHLRVV